MDDIAAKPLYAQETMSSLLSVSGIDYLARAKHIRLGTLQ